MVLSAAAGVGRQRAGYPRRGHGARWRAGRLVFLAVSLGLALPAGWTLVQVRVTNADAVAARVRQLAQPGDAVLVCPWAFGVSFHYYDRGTVPWTTLPPLEDHSIHRYDLMKARMVTPDAIAPVLAQLADALRSGHRVFMVGWLDVPPAGQAARVLPPAPADPAAGWGEANYTQHWTLQVGGYLRAHGLNATDATPHLDRPISAFEDMKLYCIQGWQP